MVRQLEDAVRRGQPLRKLVGHDLEGEHVLEQVHPSHAEPRTGVAVDGRGPVADVRTVLGGVPPVDDGGAFTVKAPGGIDEHEPLRDPVEDEAHTGGACVQGRGAFEDTSFESCVRLGQSGERPTQPDERYDDQAGQSERCDEQQHSENFLTRLDANEPRFMGCNHGFPRAPDLGSDEGSQHVIDFGLDGGNRGQVARQQGPAREGVVVVQQAEPRPEHVELHGIDHAIHLAQDLVVVLAPQQAQQPQSGGDAQARKEEG